MKKEAQLSRRGGIYRCGKTTGIASRKGRNDRGTYRRCESTAVTQRCILDGGEAVGGGGGGVVCVGCVCQYHVQCYHSEACMAGVGNDVTQYLGVSLVWNTTLHRLYFRRTTPCIKSFLQSGTQWASLPFGLTILPVNWPGSFVSNSNRVGIFF